MLTGSSEALKKRTASAVRFLHGVLSSIPEGACACGAEGHMASIGPLVLDAKGCVERLHRFAQGAADWRSGK